MFGTITIKLTNVSVNGYFPRPLNIQEPLITGGTGILTISFHPIPYPPSPSPNPVPPQPDPAPNSLGGASTRLAVVPRGLRYYLRVNEGNRVNALRLGQLVTVTGIDDEKKIVAIATPLETISTDPAVFSGPVGVLTTLSPTPA